MRRRAVGAAVTTGILLLGGSAVPASAHAQAAVRARVWVTTPDRAELLHERAPVAFEVGDQGGVDRAVRDLDA